MLSSIHPLGERARHNSWAVTVIVFTVGAMAGGAVLFGGVGTLGRFLLPGAVPPVVAGLLLAVAGIADLARVPVPGPHRQVNERWIGTYRSWVYGAGFGFQLGLGLATYVVAWSTYAVVAAVLLLGSTATGVVAGIVFGIGRSVPLLATGWIDRPSRLSAFHRAMASLAPAAARLAGATVLAVGALAVVIS